ncbi:MAG: phage holin family protein [Gudongella sp.]|nr:phage holin family protein [Gudongella sp.]
MELTTVKPAMIGIAGTIGALATYMLGGWDSALQTLIIFMAIDYITGLLVAGVFHQSAKSEGGALESRAGARGLCRKGMILLIVLVATQLDTMSGTAIIRNAVIIGYIVNETVSIIENAGLMGIPVPDIIRKAIDVLKNQSDKPLKE